MTFRMQTSSASLVSVVDITNRIAAGGPAFGVTHEDETQVYVPAAVAEYHKMEAGQSYEMHLIPNTVAPEKTPWFAKFVLRQSDDSNLPQVMRLREAMEGGGVWTTQQAADLLGLSPEKAFWILEHIYMSGSCSKFLRFDAPNTPPAEQWYTMFPAVADVDEFEEE